MTRRASALLAGLFVSLCARTVSAGPIELFGDVSVQPTDAMRLAVPYYYGGDGMFISRDGGKTYSLLCSTGIDPSANRGNGRLLTLLSGTGALYVGSTNGLWRGDADGCGFVRVPELDKRYLGALASDPLEPLRTYVSTADNGTPNGLYVNDGTSTAFTVFGTQTDQFVNTLHVVKREGGRRFYATGVELGSEVHYYIRVSEDDAQTWRAHAFSLEQFGPPEQVADFKILAVDPKSPDAIVARISRSQPGAADSLVYSPDQGKPGSWSLVGQVTVLDAVAFGPDGALYYGDDDQDKRSLYVVRHMGEPPVRLSDTWKVGCLQYDAPHARMLACNDYTFGTVDLQSGALTPLVDMRCAERYVECPGQPSMHEVCASQVLLDFCNLGHYLIAPVCDGYDQGPSAPFFKKDLGYGCKDGKVVLQDDSGDAGPMTMTTDAGSVSAPMTSKHACGCSASPGTSTSRTAAGVLGLLVLLRVRRRRMRAAVGGGHSYALNSARRRAR